MRFSSMIFNEDWCVFRSATQLKVNQNDYTLIIIIFINNVQCWMKESIKNMNQKINNRFHYRTYEKVYTFSFKSEHG